MAFRYDSGEISGFETYSKALDYLAGMGIPKEQSARYPTDLVSVIGSLLEQNEALTEELQAAREEVGMAQHHIRRLRAQRNSIKAFLERQNNLFDDYTEPDFDLTEGIDTGGADPG
ncbi:MAG: hypothetical protein ACOCYP_02145 [Planctomycetota bacterium]